MYAYMLFAGAIGIALDFLLGDPPRMPHLVRLAGKLTQMLESMMTATLGRSVFAGFVLWFIVVGSLVFPYWFLANVLLAINPWLKVLLDAIVVFQCIAFTDLTRHVKAVGLALDTNLQKGQRIVSRIVGRDTDKMSEQDVCRAAIESGSENLNDAVIAPLFWYALLGPIGILTYRVSNTLDAMIGHRSAEYERLGKVAARIDDILNWIPARLSAALILHLKALPRYFSLRRDAVKHPSPNAGWPEAAMSHRLGVVVGGAMYQGGQLAHTARMNETGREAAPSDLDRSIAIMREAYLKAIALVALWFWLVGF